MKQTMVDDLIEAFDRSPIPEGAMTFKELHEAFCAKLGWSVSMKRLRRIIKEKTKAETWRVQRRGQQTYYWSVE